MDPLPAVVVDDGINWTFQFSLQVVVVVVVAAGQPFHLFPWGHPIPHPIYFL